MSTADVKPLIPQANRYQLGDVRLVIDHQYPRGILAHSSSDKRTRVASQPNLWVSCASPDQRLPHALGPGLPQPRRRGHGVLGPVEVLALSGVATRGDQFQHCVECGFQRFGVAFDLGEEQAAL